ncbi:MAG TPA: response regulator transcription factor [Terriglobales bacterium]|nr:response regulator transcription factor [Terriglobales bacterium]
MPKLRILIADDHEVVRHGLRVLLESRPGWEVCGEAADGWEAVSKVSELKPDIVALDIGMPNLNGLDAARQILRRAPHQKILFMTIYESEQVIRAVRETGAKGLILKSDAARELISAVEALQHNSTFFSTRVAQTCLGSTMRGRHRGRGKDVLTRRERQVVQLLAEGKSTKEVALILSLSVKTAETHRSNIMGKLGLHSISEVVLYAVRNNIVQALSPAAPILNLEEPRSDDDDEEFPVSTAAPSGGSLAE